MTDLAAIEAAAERVHGTMAPTPQYRWPLLCTRTGAEVWVKHENHTPTGAFKVRGGLVYMADLATRRGGVAGVIAATRGNHGQSIAFAARAYGLRAVIVVPHGNSVEKNRAMRALGAELIEHGHDFNAAQEHAVALAAKEGLHMVPSFHELLVRGVATYSLELLRAVSDLDTVYVPIGLGSGICGMIAARNALGLRTRIVGVVAERAAAYALSFAAGKPVATDCADTMADGVAVRIPDAQALAIIRTGAERIVTVTDAEIAAAMRAYFADTHNVAEGAGAAALAALIQERERMAGRRVGVVLSGGNVDTALYQRILAGSEA
ncbi:MAG: threonine dehydratase [Alphaproteobacteria bacterium]|nr:MAG: threonine dehydratase [Alphaproteobacteria bacterium]